jgi:hypothetical protein
LNNLHVWVFVKWELKELKIGVKESQVPGIWKKNQNQRTTAGAGYLKKPHRTAEFHEKRSQAGFWAVILLLQFRIWVSGPRQTDIRDLDKLGKGVGGGAPVASPASPFPHPPKPPSQTQRFTELIYMICRAFNLNV